MQTPDVYYKLDNSSQKYELRANNSNFDWLTYYRGTIHSGNIIAVEKDVFKILVSRIRSDGYSVKMEK